MSPTEMQMLFAAGGSSLVCKASALDIPQTVSCLTMVHKPSFRPKGSSDEGKWHGNSLFQNLGGCALPVSGLRHPEDIKIENKKANNTRSVLLCTRSLVVESSDYLRGTFSILMLDHLNAKHRDWNYGFITTIGLLPRKSANENSFICERDSPWRFLANTISSTSWWLKTSFYLFICPDQVPVLIDTSCRRPFVNPQSCYN